MTDKLETTITIEGWDENPTQEYDDGSKLSRAEVTLGAGPDGLTSGRMDSLLHYNSDGTSDYVTVLRVQGEVGGRTGAFTAVGEGTYRDDTASGTMRIVAGSGDLEGITGTVTSTSTQSDYPNMPLVIEYDLG
jgi:hypothetical protein